MSKWSDKILELSESAGFYSQTRLAKAIDWKPSTLNSWFQGDNEPNVPVLALWRLSDVLNVSLFDILPDYVEEDDSFRRVVDAVMGGNKPQPVDKSVREAIDRVQTLLIATLHELKEIEGNIQGE